MSPIRAQQAPSLETTTSYNLKKLDHIFEVGNTTKTLVNGVNIHAQPSTTAPILLTLPLGTPVKILEKRIEEHSHKGFIASWYKVAFPTKKNLSEGYVWGGLLALNSVSSVADSATVFLFGRVPEVKPSPKDADKYYPIIQINVARNGRQLASLELPAQLHYANHDYGVNIYGNQGLEAIKDILQIEEKAGGNEGYEVKKVVFWNGQELLLMEVLQMAGKAEDMAQQSLIFPKQQGGVDGQIMKVVQGVYFPYKWTGKKLKKGKLPKQ